MERLKPLAERCLQDSEARVTSPPEPVLVMTRVRETVDGEVFNLGEVLVTTCDVTLDGEPGWGMIMGHAPARASRRSCLGAFRCGHRFGRAFRGDKVWPAPGWTGWAEA